VRFMFSEDLIREHDVEIFSSLIILASHGILNICTAVCLLAEVSHYYHNDVSDHQYI
jgi:hypothetical protein